MTWRDGIPDGLFRLQGGSFELYVGGFVNGFLDGQTIVWEQSGERTVEHWAGGQLHGTRAVYDAEGRKLRESRFEHGVGVGPTLVWLPGQSEAVEEPNSFAFGRDRPEVEGARWDAFRTKLAQLHTRQ